MSSALHQGADAFLARYTGLRSRLPGDPAARDAAAVAFGRTGLPTVRDEAWKYTSLRALGENEFREALTAVEGGTLPAIPMVDAPRLVFVDGRLRADLSVLPDRIGFAQFAKEARFGTISRPEQQPVVALNTMLAEDGAMLSVAENVDAGTVLLVSLAAETEGRAIAFHPRHSVRLEEGAQLTIIEVALGSGRYLHNPVMEVVVAAGARLTHIRLQDEAPEAFHLATVYVEIDRAGFYDAFTLTLGARTSRAEFHARLRGPGATVHLNAAQLLGGNQVGDLTTVVAHDAALCASRQTVKNVLTGRARGVFQGRIEVAREAQKLTGTR